MHEVEVSVQSTHTDEKDSAEYSTHKDGEERFCRSSTGGTIPDVDASAGNEGQRWKPKKLRDAWSQAKWPMKGKAVQAEPSKAEASTQTDVSLPGRVGCLWQPHTAAETVVDVDLGRVVKEIRRDVSEVESERADLDPRHARVAHESTGMASASETVTEPDAEVSQDGADDDVGPGRSHLPLMSQAEAKPPSPAIMDPTMMEENQDADGRDAQDDDDGLREWLEEQRAQRRDYSGISDSEDGASVAEVEVSQVSEAKSDGSYFQFDELEEAEEREAAARPTSNEHQPGTKRSRPDDSWWQALNSDLVAGKENAPTLDAVGRGIRVEGKDRRGATGPNPGRAPEVTGSRIRMARGITVDSGAADNVMPRRMLRGRSQVRPSPASIAGVHYVVANDGRIPNEGEAEFDFETRDGQQMSWLFQIAEVNKTLASVSALVDSGHRVSFDKDEATGVDTSFITHKDSGRSIKMRRERNVWVVDAWIEEEGPGDIDSLFARQD